MKKKIFIFSILLLISLPAIAQVEVKENVPAPKMRPDVCQIILGHTHDDAEYKAGVDVRGNKVVKADLEENPIKLPDTIKFPINIDIAQYIGLELPKVVEMKFNVGTIEIKKDGEILFNNEKLPDSSKIELKNLCLKQKIEYNRQLNNKNQGK